MNLDEIPKYGPTLPVTTTRVPRGWTATEVEALQRLLAAVEKRRRAARRRVVRNVVLAAVLVWLVWSLHRAPRPVITLPVPPPPPGAVAL